MNDIFAFWSEIEYGQKVHPKDRAVFARVEHGFELRCLPASFMGPLKTAPIVLLYLSPGLGPSDHIDARAKAGKSRYYERWKGFQPLPGPDEHIGAWRWWVARTRDFGPWDELRSKVAVLNIGAYHSKTFDDLPLLSALPSSRMSLAWAQTVLFPQAERGERVVICLRTARFWGLQPGRRYGTSLFAPTTTRSGHMHNTPMRRRIVSHTKKILAA